MAGQLHDKGLRDKIVVITGASSGIGRAAARAFAAQGCRVALAARNGQALEQAAQECREAGGECFTRATDVTDAAEMQHLAEAALERWGRIDIWVNDAGVSLFGRAEDVPLAEFEKVIQTNLMGTVHGARAVLPVFRARRSGVMINIASLVGSVGQPFASAYVASKWAVRGFSEALRMELQDVPGVHVCTVLPPSIDTPLFQHAANHSGQAIQPVPPVHPPEEVADIIVDLAREPRREAFIGMGRAMAAMHAIVPAMAENLMARRVRRQHFQDRPSGDSPGNLFTPQADATHGGWSRPRSRRTRQRALIVASVTIAAVPLGIYAWRRLNAERSAYM